MSTPNPVPNQPAPSAAPNPPTGGQGASAPPQGAPPPSPVSPAPGLPQTPAAPGWWDSLKTPEVKAWAANKAYPDPEKALEAHMGLEKIFGADRAGRTITTPKDEADAEGWKALGEKLGVPANAADYKLPVPEGDKGEFAATAAEWMKNANIPPAMGRALAEQWNAHAAKVEAAAKQASEADLAQLKTEWGPNEAQNKELATRGFNEFASKYGIKDPAAQARFEDAMGTANFLRLFHGLGTIQAEPASAGGTKPAGSGFANPSDAKLAEIRNLQDQRRAGTLGDYEWNSTAEPRIRALEKELFG